MGNILHSKVNSFLVLSRFYSPSFFVMLTFLIHSGKSADMFRIASKSDSHDVVFCDLVKAQQECVNLAVLEKVRLTNGVL